MAKIIAELCQNHNGKWEILKNMIWKAKEAGADYAKVQSMLASEIPFRQRFEEGVTENGVVKTIKRPYQPEFDRLQPMDLTDRDFERVIDECKAADIEPMTTVFTRARIPFLSGLGMKAVKVASYDCGSYPMIRELKERFKHVYVSTGATFDEEIKKTAEILKDHSASFLHCVTIYPTPLDVMNLKRMEWLKQFCPNIGYSDHSLTARDGINASVIALALGASCIERHYTVLPSDQSRDGPVSINPEQLKQLVEFASMKKEEIMEWVQKNVPNWEVALGTAERTLTPEELRNRDYYRGRFASKVNGEWIDNWEEKKVF